MNEILQILEASLKKHGDKPITVSHLKNIIKMAKRSQERQEQEIEQNFNEVHGDLFGDRG
jgi:hypothetical protein